MDVKLLSLTKYHVLTLQPKVAVFGVFRTERHQLEDFLKMRASVEEQRCVRYHLPVVEGSH